MSKNKDRSRKKTYKPKTVEDKRPTIVSEECHPTCEELHEILDAIGDVGRGLLDKKWNKRQYRDDDNLMIKEIEYWLPNSRWGRIELANITSFVQFTKFMLLYNKRALDVNSLNSAALLSRASYYELAYSATEVQLKLYRKQRPEDNPHQDDNKIAFVPDVPQQVEKHLTEVPLITPVEDQQEEEVEEKKEEENPATIVEVDLVSLPTDEVPETMDDVKVEYPPEKIQEWTVTLSQFLMNTSHTKVYEEMGLQVASQDLSGWLGQLSFIVASFSKMVNGVLKIVTAAQTARWCSYAVGKLIILSLESAKAELGRRFCAEYGERTTSMHMEFARKLFSFFRREKNQVYAKQLITDLSLMLLQSEGYSKTTAKIQPILHNGRVVKKFDPSLKQEVPQYYYVYNTPMVGVFNPRLWNEYFDWMSELRKISAGSNIGPASFAHQLYYGLPMTADEFVYVGAFQEYKSLHLDEVNKLYIHTKDSSLVDFICFQDYQYRRETAIKAGKPLNSVKKRFIYHLVETYQKPINKKYGGAIPVTQALIPKGTTCWFPRGKGFAGSNIDIMSDVTESMLITDNQFKDYDRYILVDLYDIHKYFQATKGSIVSRLSASLQIYQSRFYVFLRKGECLRAYKRTVQEKTFEEKLVRIECEEDSTSTHMLRTLALVGESFRADCWITRFALVSRLLRCIEANKMSSRWIVPFNRIYSIDIAEIAARIPELSFEGMGYEENVVMANMIQAAPVNEQEEKAESGLPSLLDAKIEVNEIGEE